MGVTGRILPLSIFFIPTESTVSPPSLSKFGNLNAIKVDWVDTFIMKECNNWCD